MSINEAQLNRWAKAPSETEETKSQRTVSRISNIIKENCDSRINIFLQGSYKNRTNIKLDSDVDIVVLNEDYYFPDVHSLPEEDREKYWDNFKGSDYKFQDFKNDIQKILEKEFDYGEVERKNKCIKIKKNSYRVDADVVPCFSCKRYGSLHSANIDIPDAQGIKLISDPGNVVTSFPNQHYKNGVLKNKNTDYNYKSIVRVLKHAKSNLSDSGLLAEKDMSSFFLECLVWNVSPDFHFRKINFSDITKTVVSNIWDDMDDIEKYNKYAEVSDLQWLFKGFPERTPQQVKNFMAKIWDYLF